MAKKIAVRYFSRGGNTKKLAEAVARGARCKAETMETSLSSCDILFIGASVYYGGVDKQVKEFIKGLDGKKIGRAVIFSTSALAQRAYPQMKKLLEARGIPVAAENFYCRGKFSMLHEGRPNAQDCKEAEAFAAGICR